MEHVEHDATPSDRGDMTAPTGVVQMIVDVFERTKLSWDKFRTKQLQAYEYVIGNQIDEKIREELRAERRPALVFNLMQNKIVTIGGLLESNQTFLRAIPSEEGDVQRADIHTRVTSDWAMKDAWREFAKAGLDAAIGGIGYINQYWSTRESVQGQWYTECADPRMVWLDPEARPGQERTMRFVIVSGWYSAEEIIAMHSPRLSPEKQQAILEADRKIRGAWKARAEGMPEGWADKILKGVTDVWDKFTGNSSSVAHNKDYSTSLINDYCDARTGRYRVIEFHDRRTKIVDQLYHTQTRATVDMKEVPNEDPVQRNLRIEKSREQLNAESQGGWRRNTFTREELWITSVSPVLMPAEPIMEQPYAVHDAGFAIKPVFCYDFHPDITKTQSIIDVLVDPQDSFNQRRMSFLEWLMNAVNPSYLAPEGSIDKKNLESWQNPQRGQIKFYNIVQGLEPKPEHPLSEGGAALRAFAEEDLGLTETLTNITPNTQGLGESAGESGVLFAQKVQRAMTALSYFFGNLHITMKAAFTFTDRSLQVYLDMPRRIRILNNENDPEWLMLNMPTIMGTQNDYTEGKYDFKVDTTTLGETARQVKFQEALEFIRLLPPDVVKWDELFKLWDSPVAQKMGQYAAAVLGVAVAQQAQQAVLQNVTGAAGAVQQLEQAAMGPGGPTPQGQGPGARNQPSGDSSEVKS